MTFVNKSEFARHINRSHQYVSSLIKHGRIVLMRRNGKEMVNLEASLAKIQETASPAHDPASIMPRSDGRTTQSVGMALRKQTAASKVLAKAPSKNKSGKKVVAAAKNTAVDNQPKSNTNAKGSKNKGILTSPRENAPVLDGVPASAHAGFPEDDDNDAVDISLSNSSSVYQESRAEKESYAARLRKIEYEEKMGIVVSREGVAKAAFDVARVLREKLKALPTRLSPRVTMVTDQKENFKILTDEVENLIREIQTAITDATDDHPSTRSSRPSRIKAAAR